MTTTRAPVVLKTMGTQTDLCLLGFESAGVAGTASGSLAVDNGLSMFATGGHNTASGEAESKEATSPSTTTFDKKAHATSAAATNNTDCIASKSTITTSTSSSSRSSAAIFSPKSAAVALSSLFNGHNTANRPRKVFPEESPEESTTSTEATTPSGMTSVTFMDTAMETDPSMKSDTSSTIGTCTDAEVAYHPEEAETQAELGNTMVTENEQALTETSAAWNGHELAMPMPPTNHTFYNNNGQQLQQPLSHPHHQSHLQHHHHGAPSPPSGVYFSNYGGPPPPGHGYHPRHPHSHAPPHPSWRHQQQGPWTPMVGKPGHPGNTATPGATPHQHPHHPSQTRPSGYTMWAHGPGMEPQETVAHHQHSHHPYGVPMAPASKDGTDPNSAVRLASNNTSLVTPTPKKAKLLEAAGTQQASQSSVGTHGHGPPPPTAAGHPMQPQQQHPPAMQPHRGPLPMTFGSGVQPATMQQQGNAAHEQMHYAGPPPSHLPPLATSSLPPSMAPSQSSYSRKKKSLGVLAENFLQRYQNCRPGTEIVVDEAATELGVERRRIYDVVNILESITIVCKKGKNTYSWLGMEFLPDVFGKLQAQAITDYHDDAVKFGLTTPEEDPNAGFEPVGMVSRRNSLSSISSEDNKNTFRSLARLSQQFLQVFLIGYDILSLPQASEMIQGTLSQEAYAAIGSAHANLASRYDPNAAPPSLDDPNEFKRAAQRGLKTKIRRLYDIANVFLSVGLLRKVDSVSGVNTVDVLGSNRRPNFQWAYQMTPQQIQGHYMDLKRKNLIHPQLLHPNLLSLSVRGVKTMGEEQDERTPSRALAPGAEAPTPSTKTPESAITTETDSSGTLLTITMDRSSRPPSSQSNETTPSVSNASSESMGPPSSAGSKNGNQDAENESGRVLLANIHQCGGAYHHSSPHYAMSAASTPAHPATRPPKFSRLVSLPTQSRRKGQGAQKSAAVTSVEE